MLEILTRNYNYRNQAVRLYELGRVYFEREDGMADEPKVLSLGAYGDGMDFFYPERGGGGPAGRPCRSKGAYAPSEIRQASRSAEVNLLIDIQTKLQAGKGPGYERWRKVFNLKQMANTLNYLMEHNLLEYAVLKEKAAAATAHHNELSAKIKQRRNAWRRSPSCGHISSTTPGPATPMWPTGKPDTPRNSAKNTRRKSCSIRRPKKHLTS